MQRKEARGDERRKTERERKSNTIFVASLCFHVSSFAPSPSSFLSRGNPRLETLLSPSPHQNLSTLLLLLFPHPLTQRTIIITIDLPSFLLLLVFFFFAGLSKDRSRPKNPRQTTQVLPPFLSCCCCCCCLVRLEKRRGVLFGCVFVLWLSASSSSSDKGTRRT